MKNHIIIALDSKELKLLRGYIVDCDYNGFIGNNNYYRVNEMREFFYRWHLNCIKKKILKGAESNRRYITLTLPELKTLQAMFRRVDCCKDMITLQDRFYPQIA
jgi:hypothetical protein